MFRGLTIRLTLFNAAVILAILAIAGALTYLSVRYILQESVSRDLRRAARSLAHVEAFRAAYGQGYLSGGHREHEESEGEGGEEAEGRGGTLAYPAFLFDTRGRLLRSLIGSGEEVEGPLPYLPDVQAVLASPETRLRTVGRGENSWRVLSTAVVSGGQVVGAVQLAAPVGHHARLLSALMVTLLGVGLGGLLLAMGGGYLLTTRALRPVREAFTRQREFIADASHELRTPVAVVRADAEALRRTLKGLSPEDAQLLDDLVQESAFLGQVVDQLVAAARLEGGVDSLRPEPLDLAELVRDTARAIEPLARERGVAVSVSVPQESVPVFGDRAHLRLALMGLLDNAVKYNRPGGSVTVQLEYREPWATVSVQDTGPGMPPEERERVFQRFYRAEAARASGVAGAGLGLTIARQVARRHGGDVALQSWPGRGTTVTLRVRTA